MTEAPPTPDFKDDIIADLELRLVLVKTDKDEEIKRLRLRINKLEEDIEHMHMDAAGPSI